MTGPGELRARFARRSPAQLIEAIAALRPRPGDVPGYATRVALREPVRRAQFLDAQLDRLDELIGPLVTERAPGLLALPGAGPDTTALLLVTAGDHPERLRSESSRAHLRGAAPVPASSGKTAGRHRLNRGGDRPANSALRRIVIVRMSSPGHPRLRRPPQRRRTAGDRDHPLPEAVPRARGLPPAPRRRLTRQLPGGGRTPDPAAAPAGLQTIGRPPRDPVQPGQQLTHHSFRSGLALRTAAAPRAGLDPICRPLRTP